MDQKHLLEKRKIWRQLVDQYKDLECGHLTGTLPAKA